MSPDVIGMIVALFAFTFSVLGGVAALLSRQTKTLETRFDGLDKRLDRLELRMDRLELRMDRLEGEVSETKIAIARLEGPLPRLQRI